MFQKPRPLGGVIHLRRAGIDPEKDVIFIRSARFHPHERPDEALRQGEVECIHLLASDNRGLDKEGYPILLESRKIYPQGRPDRVIVATCRMIEEDSDLLMAYLRATIRAYWFITDYERNRAYLEALVRRLRRACLDEEEAQRSGLEGGGRLSLPFDGAPSLQGLHTMVEEAKETGEIDPGFDLAKILRLELVQGAFKELAARDGLKEVIRRVRAIYDGKEGSKNRAE